MGLSNVTNMRSTAIALNTDDVFYTLEKWWIEIEKDDSVTKSSPRMIVTHGVLKESQPMMMMMMTMNVL